MSSEASARASFDKLRAPGAFLLLLADGVLLLGTLLYVVISGGSQPTSLAARLFGALDTFLSLTTLALPVVALLLVAVVRPVLAKVVPAVAAAATAELGAAVVLGLVSILSGLVASGVAWQTRLVWLLEAFGWLGVFLVALLGSVRTLSLTRHIYAVPGTAVGGATSGPVLDGWWDQGSAEVHPPDAPGELSQAQLSSGSQPSWPPQAQPQQAPPPPQQASPPQPQAPQPPQHVTAVPLTPQEGQYAPPGGQFAPQPPPPSGPGQPPGVPQPGSAQGTWPVQVPWPEQGGWPGAVAWPGQPGQPAPHPAAPPSSAPPPAPPAPAPSAPPAPTPPPPAPPQVSAPPQASAPPEARETPTPGAVRAPADTGRPPAKSTTFVRVADLLPSLDSVSSDPDSSILSGSKSAARPPEPPASVEPPTVTQSRRVGGQSEPTAETAPDESPGIADAEPELDPDDTVTRAFQVPTPEEPPTR